jgi:hypothetical protein
MDDVMKISIKNKSADPTKVALVIQRYIDNNSRFTGEVDLIGKTVIKIRNIRLRDSRKYCGNHPNECEFPGAPLRKSKYLEGADWVEFNDTINDILDALAVDANVATAVCKVRKNKKRRMYYGSHMHGNFWQWNMDEEDDCYENWIHRSAPNSEYPFGTPGVYERKNEWTHEIGRMRWQYGGEEQSIMQFILMSNDGLYWSDGFGWTDNQKSATIFKNNDILMTLQPDSNWVRVGDCD